ncbi:MAG TPA: 50S ribosomal protein L9 [Candidatus Peribacteria bacterium]|nr:50S ribosomal protein L9 [Candidatus Peribacteria bacterium]
MEVLLLTDIPGIGRRSDVIVVGNGFALNHLLPSRKALVVTPNVRRRYAEQIKKRAIERDSEKSLQLSTISTLKNQSVTLTKKASKTGKLYAAVTEKMIAEALASQLKIIVSEGHINLEKSIKSTGKHAVVVKMGDQTASITVEVKGDAKEAE